MPDPQTKTAVPRPNGPCPHCGTTGIIACHRCGTCLTLLRKVANDKEPK